MQKKKKLRHKGVVMLGFLMYFPHSAQVTRNAHETMNPAKRRVFVVFDLALAYIGASFSYRHGQHD